MADLNLSIPDPEVSSHRTQKRYTKAYKLRILSEVDNLVGPGEIAALLRREGMYASTLSDFRSQLAQGKLSATSDQTAKASPRNAAHDRQVAKLERENRRLRRDLSRATLVIDVQKKVSELLGITLAEVPEDLESQS
jgi:transposase-like protein